MPRCSSFTIVPESSLMTHDNDDVIPHLCENSILHFPAKVHCALLSIFNDYSISITINILEWRKHWKSRDDIIWKKLVWQTPHHQKEQSLHFRFRSSHQANMHPMVSSLPVYIRFWYFISDLEHIQRLVDEKQLDEKLKEFRTHESEEKIKLEDFGPMPEMIDDFIRNYFRNMGLNKTLATVIPRDPISP